MALTPQILYADLAATRAAGGFPFTGFSFDQMAWAVAFSVASWGVGQKFNLGLTGIATGTAGGGAVNPLVSRLVVPPNPGVVIGSLASAGMVGALGVSLGTVVGLAIPKTFSTVGQYSGVSLGVGVGADVSKITTANAATLIPILSANLASFLGPGPASPMMAVGLGNGIALLLLAGTGSGSVVGPPSISPGGGSTQSVVV